MLPENAPGAAPEEREGSSMCAVETALGRVGLPQFSCLVNESVSLKRCLR